MTILYRFIMFAVCCVLTACSSLRGPAGDPGPAGKDGTQGPAGANGAAGPAGKDSTVSGSRLTAQYLVGDDGSRSFSGWYDTALAAPCAYGKASDGVYLDAEMRCMPGGSHVFPPIAAELMYSDPNCTAAIVFVQTGALPCDPSPAGYWQLPYNDGSGLPCNSGHTVVDVTAKLPTPLTEDWRLVQSGTTGTFCAHDPVAPSGGDFYSVTLVKPSSMVSATIQ